MKLEEITQFYPSDKCKIYGHNYIPGYEDLLKDIQFSAKVVLEIGIGCGEHEHAMQRTCNNYKSGNSIRMWRDYFELANVYAIDIFEEGMIKDEDRIETFVADQSSGFDLIELTQKIGGSYDFICDDGSHWCDHQVFSFKVLEKYLNPGGIYVIEDVQPPFIDSFKDLSIFGTEYAQYIRENYNISFYDTRIGHTPDDFLMCFTKKTFAFVMTRCMRKEEHKKLWYICYKSIRQFYKNTKIIIIDDNSLLTDDRDSGAIDTVFIKSEFSGAGEILPYYYFLKQKWADKIIVLHDSMFLARKFTNIELSNPVKFLWHFSNHKWDDDELIEHKLKCLSNYDELINLNRQKDCWIGCFGVTSIIDWLTLDKLNNKYRLEALVNHISNRDERMALERIFGLIMFNEKLVTQDACSLFGSILNYHNAWLATYDFMVSNMNLYPYAVLKTWNSR